MSTMTQVTTFAPLPRSDHLPEGSPTHKTAASGGAATVAPAGAYTDAKSSEAPAGAMVAEVVRLAH